ncbi:DUF3883 domain-containing protein [uncultured Maribacter sp.]|uniref:DUF3883 domain-containing protein n=1 Tax=uncultured Maribacter sp. TaxID=431308 RepID=UPI00260EC866|nr:DUF3883 domain-containing protein [uncultured Maribacter sp.]
MHIDILIDASGSMGYMKGAGEEHENKYLIDAQHTRTDLVKSILVNHLIPKIDYCTSLQIDRFRNLKKLDVNGNPIIKNKRYIEYPKNINHYKGNYNKDLIVKKINSIPNPEPGGTPLRWCLLNKIHNLSSTKSNIIVITDGDGYLDSKTDTDWHNAVYKRIIDSKKDIKIHIVGIAQSDVAKTKSKELCIRTKGVYTNLDSINYDASKLDGLLFNLKTNITSQVIKEQIEPSQSNSTAVKDSIVESKSVDVLKQEEKVSNENLEERVVKNTQSLSLISNQLDNIIKLLQSNESINEEAIIDVIENEEHNNRVGYKAEKYLYAELLKNNWEEVIWVNEESEQYLPYDFKVSNKGEVFYYECKGTASDSNEFLVTKNEWQFYLENRKNYRLCFVSNVDSQPSYIRFMDLINDIEESKLIPCSSVNKQIKADRIIFQVL